MVHRFSVLLAFVLSGVGTAGAGELSVSTDTLAAITHAQALIRDCKYDEADALVQPKLQAAPAGDRGMLLVLAGTLDEHRGNLAAALAKYQAAVAGDPVPADALRFLGRAQITNKQFEEGHRSLTAYVANQIVALKLSPTSQDMVALSVASAETGRTEEALKLLDHVIEGSAAYVPLVVELKRTIQQVLEHKAPAVPGSYWTLAYGGDAAITMPSKDFSPTPIERVAPAYPRRAARDGVQGYVDVEVTIDKEGNVTDAKVVEAKPRNMFESETIAALYKWKFRPTTKDCRAVEGRGMQRIRYMLK